jgi:hypothetical protein
MNYIKLYGAVSAIADTMYERQGYLNYEDLLEKCPVNLHPWVFVCILIEAGYEELYSNVWIREEDNETEAEVLVDGPPEK